MSRHRHLAPIAAALAVLPMAVIAQAPGAAVDPAFEKAFAQRRRITVQQIALPTVLDGREVGAVTAQIRGPEVRYAREALVTVLGNVLLPERLQALKDRSGGDWVDATALVPLGIQARYSPQTITLTLDIALEARRIRTHRIDSRQAVSDEKPEPEADIRPQPWSLIGNMRWVGSTSRASGNAASTNARLHLEPALRWHPWVLEAAGSMPLGAGGGTRVRDMTRIIRDWPEQSLRLTLGDLSTGARPGLPATALGGIQLSRRFNLTPAVSTLSQPGERIALPQGASVDVVVNGKVSRTLQLGPGVHDLQDIPVFSGANTVELRIVEPGGKTTVRQFDYFFDSSLLAPGLAEFDLATGAPAVTGANGPQYQRTTPVTSASLRYGIRPDVTTGFALQHRRTPAGAVLFWQTDWLFASPAGTVAAYFTGNRHPGFTGQVTSLQWRQQSPLRLGDPRPRWSWSTSAQWTHRRHGHANVSADSPGKGSTDAGLRIGAVAPGGMGLSGSWARARPHDGSPPLDSANLTLRQRLSPQWSLEAGLRWERQDQRRERSLGISLRWSGERQPDGSGQRAMGSADSFTRRVQLDAETWGVASVAQADAPWRLSLGAARSREGTERSVRAQMMTSRAEWTAQLSGNHAVSGSTQFADVSVASSLILTADGWALAPPVNDSAAILRPRPAYGALTINIDPSGPTAAASSDRWGAPVLADLNAYTPREIQLDIANLPPGLGLGVDRPRLWPAYRSVLAVPVGSDANVQVTALLQEADGGPAGLRALQLVADAGGPAIDLFTSRRGQFTSPPLRPGRYQLRPAGESQVLTRFTITPDQQGIVSLGAIVQKGAER